MRFETIRKLYEHLLTGMHIIGSGIVFILMVVIVVDVFGRSFFNQPLTGTPELVKVSLVGLLFLGMAKTLRMGKHIRATVIVHRASPRIAAGLNFFTNLCGLIVFTLLLYSSWSLTIEAWKVGEFEGAGALRVPTYPLRTLIVVCSFLTAIQFVMNLIHDGRRLLSGKEI